MAGLFPPPSESRPTFKDDSDAIPYKAQPLGPKSFTGMVNNASLALDPFPSPHC